MKFKQKFENSQKNTINQIGLNFKQFQRNNTDAQKPLGTIETIT